MRVRSFWRAAGAMLLVLCTVGLPVSALAQTDDGLPAGRVGISLGVRQGFGQLGDDFGVGGIGAVEAGYHPTSVNRRFSFGLHWSVLWGWFGANDPASVAGSLNMIEINLGGRMRAILDPSMPRFLSLGSGVSLLRTNVPIPPQQERIYLGPYVSLGIEQFERFFFGEVLLSFEARYGLLFGGPGSLSMLLGVSFGT